MNKQGVTRQKKQRKTKQVRALRVPRDPISAILETELRCGDVLCSARDDRDPFLRTIWRDMRGQAPAGIGRLPTAMEPVAGAGSLRDHMAGIAAGGKRGAFCGTTTAPPVSPGAEAMAAPYVLHDLSGRSRHGALTAGFALTATNCQESADFALIAHRIAEMALCPGSVTSPYLTRGLTYEMIAELDLAQIEAFLGHAQDTVDCRTEAQKQVFGDQRRRIPRIGPEQTRPAVAANPIELVRLAETALAEFAAVTKRSYQLTEETAVDGADIVLIVHAACYDLVRQRLDTISERCGRPVGLIRPVLTLPYPRQRMAAALRGKQVLIVDEPHAAPSRSQLQDIELALAEAMTGAAGIQSGLGDDSAVGFDQTNAWPRLYTSESGPHPDIEALAALVRDLAAKAPARQHISLGGDAQAMGPEAAGYAVAYAAPDPLDKVRKLAEYLLHYFGFNSALRLTDPHQATLTWAGPAGGAAADPGVDLLIYDHRDPDALVPAVRKLRPGATLLLCTSAGEEEAWQAIPQDCRKAIRDLGVRLYTLAGGAGDRAARYGWSAAILLGGFVETARHQDRSGLDTGLLRSALKIISSNGDLSALQEIEGAIGQVKSVNHDKLPDGGADQEAAAVVPRLEQGGGDRGKDAAKVLQRDLFNFHLTGDHGPLARDPEWERSLRSVHHDRFRDMFAGEALSGSVSEVLERAAHIWRQTCQTGAGGFLAGLDVLLVRLSDRVGLGGDQGDSDVNGLAASFGASFAGDLDFDTFSQITRKSGTGEAVPQARLERITRAVETIHVLRSLFDAKDPVALDLGLERGCAGGLGRFRAYMHDVLQFFKAVQIVELEAENKYEPASHDAYFAGFGIENLTQKQAEICPPYLLALQSRDLNDSDQAMLLEAMTAGYPIKILLLIDDICAPAESDFEAAAFRTTTLFAAATTLLNRVFVAQTTAAQMKAAGGDLSTALAFLGPALYCVFCPDNRFFPGLRADVISAMAHSARAIPAFTYNPDAALPWTERFDLSQNPEIESDYPVSEIEFADADDKTDVMALPYGFLDYLYADLRFRKHFLSLSRSQWHSALKHFGKYVALSPDNRRGKIPYIWAVGPDAVLYRVIPAFDLAAAALKVDGDWRILRQMCGQDQAALQALLEKEKKGWQEAKDREIQELLNKNREALEQASASATSEVIANIASGLLNLGAGVPTSSARSPETAAPDAGQPSPPAPDAGQAPPAPAEAAVSQASASAPEPSVEEEEIEEEEPEGAYIETLRCTTCNECTDLNSRMFAYDENKQAYIKDPAAGTFRELVEAAEKCPVGIIHPGTPLNPDEPGLEDLRKRAEAFS